MHRRVLPVLHGLLALAILAPTPPLTWGGELRAQTTEAIEGTPHDFAPEGAPTTDGCVVCHLTPDNGGSKGGPTAMGQETLMCLSCHDGVNAPSTGSASSSHPSSVTYPQGDGYRSPAEVEERGAHLATGEDGRRVECTSCHNPHDNTRGDFLRVANQGSALCFACHIK